MLAFSSEFNYDMVVYENHVNQTVIPSNAGNTISP